MHELVALADDTARENVEFIPYQALGEELVMVRCASCKGLRAISARRLANHSGRCPECRSGNVVPRWTFCTFWTERFTMEEIRDMAQAIWG